MQNSMRKCAIPLLRKRRIQLDRASVPPRSPAEISDRFPISAISISRKKFRIFFGGLPPAPPSRFAVRRGKARGRRIPPKPRRTARRFTIDPATGAAVPGNADSPAKILTFFKAPPESFTGQRLRREKTAGSSGFPAVGNRSTETPTETPTETRRTKVPKTPQIEGR